MLKEAIEYLKALADQASRTKAIHLEADPPHRYHLFKPDGSVEALDTDPGYRQLTVNQIGDLVALAKKHFDPTIADGGRLVCAYSVGESGEVRLVFDHTNGREYATVPLTPTAEWCWFHDRFKEPLLEVRDLRQALRITLRKCFQDAKLVDGVSSLSFRDTDGAAAAATRGRESMGRSILQEVEQPEQLPDELQTFNVRMFQNADLDVRFPLTCILDPDTKTRRWFIQPTEDSWSDYLQAVDQHIGDQLRDGLKDTNVHVYSGLYDQA